MLMTAGWISRKKGLSAVKYRTQPFIFWFLTGPPWLKQGANELPNNQKSFLALISEG